MKTKDQALSDAYLHGWMTRHKGGPRRSCPYSRWHMDKCRVEWWNRGWDDCDRGAMDAESALGPELLVDGGKRYGEI